MRPLALAVEGFGGFRQPTVLDFDDLELIALVGKTGSGKSTMLDAITFALYGMVARYDDARKVHPVINSLANEAKVQFRFESGGGSYNATRVIRRTKTGASTKEARLEHDERVLAEGAKEVTAAVEELLGLDFTQFTKVVLLPQGRFSAFLRDSAKDRRQMLTETLGIDRYDDIGKRAREIAKEARIQSEEKRATLERFDITRADISRLETQIVELESLQVLISEQADTARQAERSRLELAEAQTACEGWTVRLKTVGLPADVTDISQKIEAAAQQLRHFEGSVGEADGAWEAAVNALRGGPNLEQSRQSLADFDAEQGYLKQLAVVEDQLKAAKNRAFEHEEIMKGLQEKIDLVDRDLEQAEHDEQRLRRQALELPNTDGLAVIQAQREELGPLQNQLVELESRRKTSDREVAEVSGQLAAAELSVAELEKRHRSKVTANQVQVLRDGLMIGKQCPVCTTTVDSLPSTTVDQEQTVVHQDIKLAEAKLARLRSGLDLAQSTKVTLDARHEATAQQMSNLKEKLVGAPTEAQIADTMVAADKLALVLAEATTHRENLRGRARKLRSAGDFKTAKDQQRQASIQLQKLEKKQAVLTSQHKTLLDRLDGVDSPAILTEAIDEATKLADNVDSHQAARSEAHDELSKLKEDLRALETQEAAMRSAFIAARDQLGELGPPAPSNISLLEDWHRLVDWAVGQLDTQHKIANSLALEIVTAEKKISQCTSLVSAAVVDCGNELLRVTHSELLILDGLAMIDKAQKMVLQGCSAGEAQREALTRQLQQAEELRVGLEKAEERFHVYEMLGDQLKASNFQDWILGEIVAALAARGSERLYELSAGQFSLEANELNFDVIDHTNGDTKRDARTLSGGETFLASLALALALADGIVDMSTTTMKPLDSLFLDEGFGTLDGDYLDVVAAAVEELGAQGRLVVVITHIDELAERMPTRFEITKSQGISRIDRVDT